RSLSFLHIVSSGAGVRWHRSGFALYWRAISRARRLLGRKRISKEVRELIFRMVVENPRWGAPRIHGELLMLGFDVSERSISRWMQRAPRDPEPATTTRTGPILAWTSKLRPAEFNPCSGGLSFLDPDWVACITATIEQRNLRVVYFAISSFPV